MKTLERLEQVLKDTLWVVSWTLAIAAVSGVHLPWRR